jgi:hypothetical protein
VARSARVAGENRGGARVTLDELRALQDREGLRDRHLV